MVDEAQPPPMDQLAAPSGRRLAAALLSTTATGLVLLRLGDGELGVPLSNGEDLRAWVDETAPIMLAMSLVRLIALGLCAYLALALVLASIGTIMAGRADRQRPSARPLPRWLAHLLASSAGVGLAGTALPLVGPSSALAAPAGDEAAAVMVKLAPEELPPGTPPAPPSPEADQAEDPAAEAEAEPPEPETWIVTAGDSFWSIAEEILADRAMAGGNRPPDESAVSRYWFELIAANRDLLADADDPDLLFTGQELRVPQG